MKYSVTLLPRNIISCLVSCLSDKWRLFQIKSPAVLLSLQDLAVEKHVSWFIN